MTNAEVRGSAPPLQKARKPEIPPGPPFPTPMICHIIHCQLAYFLAVPAMGRPVGVRAIFGRGAGSILPEKYGAAPEK